MLVSALSENGRWVGMAFSFSLYAAPLLAILVVYLCFGNGLGELKELELLEGGKMCCCQHQKKVSVLVNFQDS